MFQLKVRSYGICSFRSVICFPVERTGSHVGSGLSRTTRGSSHDCEMNVHNEVSVALSLHCLSLGPLLSYFLLYSTVTNWLREVSNLCRF